MSAGGDEPVPQLDDATFLGLPLFGCFYYAVRDGTTIRPHFANNDQPGMRLLSRDRVAARRDELRRMFTHIRETVPAATTVMGHSWLYNLPAYTRLFPPSYTRQMEEESGWCAAAGWCSGITGSTAGRSSRDMAAFSSSVWSQATDLADLRFCFPYQRLRPQAPIADFYAFYGISV